METTDLFIRLLLALALGTLIGLEREYSQIKKGFRGYGGIRTFPLITLLGALSAFLAERYSPVIIWSGFWGIIIFIAISHYFLSSKQGRIGLTTEVAGIVTFLIGVLSYIEDPIIPIAIAIVMTLFLYTRIELHQFAGNLKKDEMYSTIKFAIIAFVILPLLPDKQFGPFLFFNPYSVWLMVVLVSGISFVGYILVRFLGKHGTAVTGFLGGFVSSTATTLSMAERSSQTHDSTSLVFATLAANTAMIVKILFIIFIFNKELFITLLVPMGIIIAGSILIAAPFSNPNKNQQKLIEFTSPFILTSALKFGAIFAFILFLVRFAVHISQKSFYAITFFSGLFDADATVLSALQLLQQQAALNISTAVILVIIANTISKIVIAHLFGKKTFANKATLPLLGVVIVSILSLLLV